MPLIPSVTKEQTAAFAKAWDSGGVKIILDNTSIQFATDWANIALKSFVADMAAQVKKVAEAKIAAQKKATEGLVEKADTPPDAVSTQTAPAPTPASKSGIVLTD